MNKEEKKNKITNLFDELDLRFNSDYPRSEFIDVTFYNNVEEQKLIIECHDRFKFQIKRIIKNYFKNTIHTFKSRTSQKVIYYITY